MVDFSYKNITNNMVILKCIGPDRFFLEKAIFPSEVFSFMAPKNSNLEIWGIESYGPRLEQRHRLSDAQREDHMAAMFYTT
tara:strand:- start:189 stop:431 length:243 start_codon:yes stop_codon:yes gene_type:complete